MPRRALPLLLVALLALAACGEDGEPSPAPTASPTTTAAPSPTPTTTPIAGARQPPARWQEFRAFAVEIEQALEADDAWFFANRGTESMNTCPGERYPTGELAPAGELVPAYEACYEKPAGTVLRGIPIFFYARKLLLLPRDEYATSLQSWFADPLLTGDLSTGAVALHALAFSGIVDHGLPGRYKAIVRVTSAATEDRKSGIFYFNFLDGEWRLTFAEVGVGAALLLCDPFFYDYCERWEGSAP